MMSYKISHSAIVVKLQLHENLHEIVFQVSASQDLMQNGMGQGVALIDGHCVGDLVPIIHDNSSGTARGI